MDRLKKYIMPFVLIFLIPQVANILSCLMMNDKQIREVPMAVYMGDDTSVTREIVKSFDNNETFDVKYYVENPNDIEKLMNEGEIAFGLVIPEDFTIDVKNLKSPSLMTVIDGSQLSVASFTKIASSEILMTIKAGALINLMKAKFNMSFDQAKSAAMAMDITSRILGNPTRNYINFLLPGMMTALAQVGIAMAASAAINREKRKTLFTYILLKVMAYAVIGCISIMMILGVQMKFFGLPMKANWSDLLLLCGAFSLSVASVGILFSAVFWNKVLASQVAAIYFIPSSILSGFTWPLISMPKFFQNISHIMPFTHFGDTLRDLLVKGEAGLYGKDMRVLLTIAVISFALAMGAELLREAIMKKRGGDELGTTSGGN